MVRAYPFHPALIEILRDRWGSISGFQRTRGVLRLLALIVGDLYRAKQASPLIQPAHVNLDDGELRNELLEYVDNRGDYESAILSDIGGTAESKAPLLDRVTGGDYARHRIATGLATAIFMYSHSGATQRAPSAERPQLWLATLQPGVVPALAADALDKLQRRLWYLVYQEGTYRFDSQPNLNQMLVTRIDAIRQEPDAIREKLREAVEEVTGGRPFPQAAIWPAGPIDVRTGAKLALVVLDPRQAWGSSEREQGGAQAFIQSIFKSAGNTFRQLKNTLAFVLSTVEGVRLMEDAAVQLLALEAIHRQYRPAASQDRGAGRRGGGLSEIQVEDLETRLDRARKGLPGAVWGAYTVIIAPTGRAEANEAADGETTLWVRQEHGFPGYRPGEHSLGQRVWKRMMDDQRLLDRLDPRLISEGKGDQWRLWPAEDEAINVATLWDYFCRFPYLPMLTGSEALQNTVSWGVQRGLFAYALGDGTDVRHHPLPRIAAVRRVRDHRRRVAVAASVGRTAAQAAGAGTETRANPASRARPRTPTEAGTGSRAAAITAATFAKHLSPRDHRDTGGLAAVVRLLPVGRAAAGRVRRGGEVAASAGGDGGDGGQPGGFERAGECGAVEYARAGDDGMTQEEHTMALTSEKLTRSVLMSCRACYATLQRPAAGSQATPTSACTGVTLVTSGRCRSCRTGWHWAGAAYLRCRRAGDEQSGVARGASFALATSTREME